MSLAFRERLASDMSLQIHLTESEKANPAKYCHISDEIIDRDNPDSLDRDSIICAMGRNEFARHVQEVYTEGRRRDKIEQEEKIKEQERQKAKVKEALKEGNRKVLMTADGHVSVEGIEGTFKPDHSEGNGSSRGSKKKKSKTIKITNASDVSLAND